MLFQPIIAVNFTDFFTVYSYGGTMTCSVL